ncbi:hypothetical protein HELRODRAFT_136734, partial [Helobdella robusta]|uniref:RNA helicase n=1 Tax=Helobdella robusta TaxID=6412 RepID=T1EIF6_HELRO
ADEINRLPIYRQKKLIKKEIRDNDSLVLVGETGSGKTTQVPKFVFQANINRYKCIAVTQPRRVAAVSLAKRVAVELGSELGHTVGYIVRFDSNTSTNTRIIFMTDGMLLREALLDPLL